MSLHYLHVFIIIIIIIIIFFLIFMSWLVACFPLQTIDILIILLPQITWDGQDQLWAVVPMMILKIIFTEIVTFVLKTHISNEMGSYNIIYV